MEPEILCERRGAAGHVTLNRPKALNALTHGMVRILAEALDAFEADPEVTRVVVEGAGGKAFCAGGDIRRLYELGRAGRQAEMRAFWADEYRLNARIARYPKPYVALVDGIVMGGGVGLSLHGSHVVAGDGWRFAMPEVGIGFAPDVGATHLLPRLPGEFGAYIATTGARIGPDDAASIGLATARVPSAAMAELRERLLVGDPVDSAIAAVSVPAADGPAVAERATIDACFAAGDVATILARLDAAGTPFATETAAAMRTKSPASMALALAQVRAGRDLTVEDSLRLEYRIVSRIADGRDFYEGVRAVIVDKDGAPRWSDPSDPAFVAAQLASLGPDELVL